MKIKTAELEKQTLDWAVAKVLGRPRAYLVGETFVDLHSMVDKNRANVHWSTDWAQGGPIIEREYIDIAYLPGNCTWVAVADLTDEKFEQYGPTPLIAAMRCYVASQLGDEVEVPNELG
jgi:hypothetical protein